MDMHIKTRPDQLPPPRRNRYFYGKLLDELHLRMEQEYFNGKRWMLNRLALGRGALCGLAVTADGKTVWVAPGVAIDGLGREIVVPSKVQIDPSKIAAQCGTVRNRDPATESTVYLTLCYRECKADFEPVLVTDCQPQEQCAASTTVEGYAIEVHAGTPPAIDTVAGLCQALANGADEATKRKDINNVLAQSPCVKGQDPCVVLAAVRFNADGNADVNASVREQVYSNEVLLELLLCSQGGGGGSGLESGLTHVTATSWVHAHAHTGADSPLAPVTLTFTPAAGDPTTENANALVVGFSGEIKLLPYTNVFDMAACFEVAVLNRVPNAPEMTRAILPAVVVPLTTVTPDAGGMRVVSAELAADSNGPTAPIVGLACLLTASEQDAIQQALQVFVRLRSDFIVDAHGKAVDGEFARGQFPTGDGPPGTGLGLQGGTFESWFTCLDKLPSGDGTHASVAVNKASAADLAAVPGISLYSAMAIVAARQKRPNQKFGNLDNLIGVGGVSAATLDRLKPNLTL